MRKVIKYVVIFLLLITIYLGSLVTSSLIPRDFIEKQVKESAETLVKEGNHCQIELGINTILLENYTTALMINNAYSLSSHNLLESSLLGRKNYLPEIQQTLYKTSSGELIGDSKYEEFDAVHELQGTVNKEITESFEYARYWHGYLVILKPLLIFLNLNQIRILSMILIITLSGYLLYQIYKKTDKKTMLLFLIGLLSCEILIQGIELQGQLNIYIMLITSIIILRKHQGNRKWNPSILFFVIGSITNFLDFFTTPILTYGFPLMIYFILSTKEKTSTLGEVLQLILKTGTAWAMGYGCTWIAKWIIVDSVFHRNIITNAIQQIQYRGLDVNYSYLQTTWRNLSELGPIYLSILIYLIFYNIILMIFHATKKKMNTKIIFYALVGIIPFIWYFVIRQHSYMHPAFTYRILYISIMANILILSENFLMTKKQREDVKEKE